MDMAGTVAYGNDYRLAPVGAPIDYTPSYDLAVDFEGEARPQGANFDVGFDETLSRRVILPIVLR